MGQFQRTYSRMYWTDYSAHRTHYSLHDRNSSRSQDSGFSDSESSSSPPLSTSDSTNSTRDEPCQNEHRSISNHNSLPKSAVANRGDLQLWGGDTLAQVFEDCEKPASNSESVYYQHRRRRGSYNLLNNPQRTSNNYLSYNSCSTATTPNPQSHSCITVDGIPEMPPSSSKETTAREDRFVEENATTTSSSSSFDKFKSDDTVRFVENNEIEPYRQSCIDEAEKVEHTTSELSEMYSPFKVISNENHLSYLDLSRLPEPTFTSTPKKEEIKILKKNEMLSRSQLIMPNDDVKTIDPQVAIWLMELQFYFEEECTRMVQWKLIAQNNRVKSSDVLMVSETVSTVQSFQQKTELIARKFSKMYEKINLQHWHLIEPSITNLTENVKGFILNYSHLLPQMELMDKENALKIMNSCDQLVNLVQITPIHENFTNNVIMLEKFFSRFVGSVLVQHILMLFSTLDQTRSETTLLNTLYGISNLDMNSSGISDIVTRLDGVRRLLSISWRSNSSQVRIAALRALEIVCQNATSIRQLEMARGIKIISDMLVDSNRNENEFCEVVSLLVQITTLCIEDDHIIRGLIYHLYIILIAITDLISSTNSCETLLLCSAALSNIIFIEPDAVFMLVKLDSVACLLQAVRRLGVRTSVFLLEQVVTVVAGMAAEAAIREYLAHNRVVGDLLCFLQVKPSLFEKDPEIAAAERMQHKIVVALSRLCTSREICQQILDFQGVSQLVHLCKEEIERNYSDEVLVACLASLRKITANCGNDSITSLNAKELVEPRLVDSYLLYTSRSESYV